MNRILILAALSFLLSILISGSAKSQDLLATGNPSLTLEVCLQNVVKGNLSYITEKFNVSIAEAELMASKAISDPEISLAYSNNQDQTLQMGQSAEAGISYPLFLGNLRKAGISVARSKKEIAGLMLDAFFQNLRADAALSFFTALKQQKKYVLQKEIHEQLTKLAEADSVRLRTGEVAGMDALQSSLEARSHLSEVYQSHAELQNSLVELMRMQGILETSGLPVISGEFPFIQLREGPGDLIDKALRQRTELMIAIKTGELSANNLKLVKAGRAPEISLEGGYSYNTIVRNEIAPAPQHHGINAGLVFPIKISSLNRGPLKAAEIALEQSKTMYAETELRISSEVVQAYNNYIAYAKMVESYNKGLIEDAGKILEGRMYSYMRGEDGFLDVLNAQRTYTELKMRHIEIMFGYTEALIELQWATGLWELSE